MPGRRRNLEIKAVDADPSATLQAALDFGAEGVGWLHQRDTYFHAVQGRLKLREAPPEPAELIAYARAELAGAESQPLQLRAALGIADEQLVARGYAHGRHRARADRLARRDGRTARRGATCGA